MECGSLGFCGTGHALAPCLNLPLLLQESDELYGLHGFECGEHGYLPFDGIDTVVIDLTGSMKANTWQTIRFKVPLGTEGHPCLRMCDGLEVNVTPGNIKIAMHPG